MIRLILAALAFMVAFIGRAVTGSLRSLLYKPSRVLKVTV